MMSAIRERFLPPLSEIDVERREAAHAHAELQHEQLTRLDAQLSEAELASVEIKHEVLKGLSEPRPGW